MKNKKSNGKGGIIMKKSILSALCLSLITLGVSCQKTEQDKLPIDPNAPTFTAYAPTTKTVLEGKKSLWNKDEILIFNGQNTEGSSQVYTTTAEKSATATFTIKNPNASFSGEKFIAALPSNVAGDAWWNGTADKTINKLWLKPEQTATANNYDPEAHIAIAYTENNELNFKNACALLKFTIGSDNIKEVCVYTTTEGAVLSGNFSFNTENNDVTTTFKGYTKNNYVKAVGTFTKGSTYYISCLPSTLDNITLEVVSTDGIKGEDKTTSKSIKIDRNGVYDLGEVVYKEKTRTIYLAPSMWANDGAVFDAYLFNDTKNQWYSLEASTKEGIYTLTFPDKWKKLVLVRMNPANERHNWASKWNQTDDIDLTTNTGNLFTITGWGDNGANSAYINGTYTE